MYPKRIKNTFEAEMRIVRASTKSSSNIEIKKLPWPTNTWEIAIRHKHMSIKLSSLVHGVKVWLYYCVQASIAIAIALKQQELSSSPWLQFVLLIFVAIERSQKEFLKPPQLSSSATVTIANVCNCKKTFIV